MINPLTGGLEFIHNENKQKKISEFSDVNENFCPVMSFLSTEEKINIIKQVGEEITNESELKGLFERKRT